MFGIVKNINSVAAVGNILNKLFTSDDERLSRAEAMERIKAQPQLVQLEINKIEAQHRSVFIAGWRPFIGWVCGFNLAYLVCFRDLIEWFVSMFKPGIKLHNPVGIDITMELVVVLLGLGGLRTFEKVKGKAK